MVRFFFLFFFGVSLINVFCELTWHDIILFFLAYTRNFWSTQRIKT
jgi:hypothetical protein